VVAVAYQAQLVCSPITEYEFKAPQIHTPYNQPEQEAASLLFYIIF